jgi:hypothetical protein
MAFIGPRMDGEPIGAGLECHSAEPFDARPRQVAAVAQEGDGIHIDGQFSSQGTPRFIRDGPNLPTEWTVKKFRFRAILPDQFMAGLDPAIQPLPER